MKSMTGYGKAELHKDGKTVTVEMKSVNHRFLEPTFKMPHILNSVEDELRRRLKEKLFRGKIDIYISYRNENDTSVSVVANKPVIAAYLNELKSIADEYGFEFKPDLKTIIELPDAFSKNSEEEEEDIKGIVFECFDAALDKFIQARAVEGVNMKNDLLLHLQNVEDNMKMIESREPEIEATLRQKLSERVASAIAELSGADGTQVHLDEDRLNVELAYYADRACIAEETVRMASHIKAMRAEIADGVNVGKKMDFMVQEMNREINTIGSKSADFDIASLVVKVKSEIEKIREQIQNVE